MSFFSTYAALRLTGNARNRPRVAAPLLKAFCLICYCIVVLPFYLLRQLIDLVQRRLDASQPTAQPRPTFPTGRPRRFADSVSDLQEDMQ